MKKTALFLCLFITIISYSQEIKQIPMINVSGEGKIKTIPDQVQIMVTIESKGNKAKETKIENDIKMDAVLKFIKNSNIAKEDFKTQNVSLHTNYDYEKKKNNYVATQSLRILVRNLSRYDEIMEGLMNAGVNRIDNVEYKTSKLAELQSESRKMAIKDAKTKAEDYVFLLNQKVGKAFLISDNSQPYQPRPVIYASMKAMAMSDEAAPRETIAPGEIEINTNVSVSFLLE